MVNKHTYGYPEVEPDEATIKDWFFGTLYNMGIELDEYKEDKNVSDK